MIKYLQLHLLLCALLFSSFALAKEHTEEQFLKNIDTTLYLRRQGIEFYQLNQAKFTRTENLTSQDIQDIYSVGSEYVKLRAHLLEQIKIIQDEVRITDRVIFTSKRPTQVKRNLLGVKTHYINLSDSEGQAKLRRVNMATTYGVMLFDNFITLIAPYYSHVKIRYLLNRDFPGRDYQLDNVAANYFNIFQRKFLLKGIRISERAEKHASENKITLTPFDQYMEKLIATSPAVEHLKDKGLFERGTITHILKRAEGDAILTTRTTTFQTSKLFGNSMGIFKSRDGLMRGMSENEKNGIIQRMKPLDVLLEKTPFRLTDTFIPGYYGHVAIWVGTETELRELGIWDHPSIVPHQKRIQEGHHIVEALRPGVQINTLDHFLDIDDMAVLRPTTLNEDQTKEYLIRAFEQIGKRYDFNFDVETNNLIVCSEIAYVVFHNVTWPTDRVMGRSTISPDHVAWEAVPGKSFMPVMLYQKGDEVKENIEEVFLKNISGPEGLK